jgi:hypothetical protein
VPGRHDFQFSLSAPDTDFESGPAAILSQVQHILRPAGLSLRIGVEQAGDDVAPAHDLQVGILETTRAVRSIADDLFVDNVRAVQKGHGLHTLLLGEVRRAVGTAGV